MTNRSIPPLQLGDPGHHLPVPVGLLTGRRTWWRRAASMAMAAVNRVVDRLPPGRWLHARALRDLEVTELEAPLARGRAGLDGLEIAFLSDIHAGSFMNEADLCRIFEIVAAQEPDMLCLGGDLINTRDREILMYREPLRRIAPPLGVFAVPGNHDHFYGKDLGIWEAFLESQGVQVLLNRGVRVVRGGASLWVAGVDDLTEGDPLLAMALDGHREEEPVLLLTHHPDFFFEAAAAGVDLTLAGHTHGGQIKIVDWIPLKHSLFDYHAGEFVEEGARLYVSRGVGVTFLPLRIGAPAEIVVARLRVTAHSSPTPIARTGTA